MGMTGTGKSSFIKLLTGNENITIGSTIDPETSDISSYQSSQDGFDVALVDTPGFDDNRPDMTDSKLLKDVTDFLMKWYDTKTVNGLIYFHRINDIRFGATATRNIRMFSRLCGPRAMKNVVIITTRWDETNHQVAEKTEKELMNSHFKELIANGATLLRHYNTIVSAQRVIRTILSFPPMADIKIVTEIKSGRSLSETEAGQELGSQLAALQAQHEKQMAELRDEYKQARKARDKEQQEELKKMREELQNRIDKRRLWCHMPHKQQK
ncbi:hypothetical protein M422DRAFT_61876 [Sphaerobolus stellatus SS14]|uniref:Unplaced genomic scaffold SPHSTscaffold_217, whole genome shotgun sequence n=1 Tax=Sphaerobolus stellatus (strain SS14) TaxID=990650 RepID=A0A0C9UJE8_SPHS4|nr:hypothetical protein M422DRAFT_61876 [Sphaerobolus stellatus SS14]